MSDHVTNFKTTHAKLMEAFKCRDDYYLRLCLDEKWCISEKEGVSFLSFHSDDNTTTAVIYKDKGSPLVYKYSGYIMIIAIDCVKVGFVFRTKNMEN